MKRRKPRKQRKQKKLSSKPPRRSQNVPELTHAPDASHPVPRTVHRRRYKVESLPEDAQSQIFEGFISHTPYRIISEQLAARGIQISRQALCRYWKERWEQEFDFLRHARTCVLFIARALKQDPNGDLARLGRELLFAMIMQKAPFLRARDPVTLLHEATAIDKASPRSARARGPSAPDSSLSEEELDRRIREIYGIPESNSSVEEPIRSRGQES